MSVDGSVVRLVIQLLVAKWFQLTASSMVHSGTPDGVPGSTDCAIRKAAWDYGRKLLPERGEFRTLFDALQLGACGFLAPSSLDTWLPARDPLPKDETVLFVTPAGAIEDGSYSSIAKALAASRAMAKPLTIALRAGTHYVSHGPVQLTSDDSGLTIRNMPGEVAIVSGGRSLKTSWKLSDACAGCFETSLAGQVDNVFGLRRNGVREIRARYPDFDPEVDGVIDGQYLVHDGAMGWITSKTAWVERGAIGMNGVPGTWPPAKAALSYVIEAKDWPSVEWPMHVMTNGTIDPDRWTGEGDWGQFWLGTGGTCVDRDPPVGYWCAPGAPRHVSTPNHPSGIMPHKSQLPHMPYARSDGAVVHAWRPGHWYTNIFEVGQNQTIPEEVVKNWELYRNSNNVYGKCMSPTTCDESITHLGTFPSLEDCQVAVNSTQRSLCATYTYHHADLGGQFASRCYCSKDFVWFPKNEDKVDSGRAPGTYNSGFRLMFSRGGHQGGEGVTGGDAWYIENVLEELDSGREWYFDNQSLILYYKPNSSSETTPSDDFVATSEKVLFSIVGSRAQPVHNITIKGLILRDTAYTYFDPHGLPSGGDWALHRQGAVTLVGTKDVIVSGNLFTNLDGNAMFIGGYNRGMVIRGNEFLGIGDSALAAWGDTSYNLNENSSIVLPYPVGPDGRGETQPRGTKVIGNLVREIGLWQKQSSFWFQAVTAQTLLQGNVFFNGPRAALNFNDGFGGADEITQNLILNTCRESSDHGPWNSWDRVPYITDFRTGKPSIIPADRHIHHNFVIGNYNAQEAIDTDDGSAYLKVYENFFAYADAGLKSDYGGHDNQWYGNIIAYAANCYSLWDFHSYNDAFVNNTCVAREAYGSDCHVDTSFNVNNNRVYTRDGQLSVCGMPWQQWLKSGRTRDTGTTLATWPRDELLISWVHQLLDFRYYESIEVELVI